MNINPLNPLLRIAIDLRAAREEHERDPFGLLVPEWFTFRQTDGAGKHSDRTIGPMDVLTINFVGIHDPKSKSHKRNLRDAFKNRFKLKASPPKPGPLADMAYCEEDNGFYLYNGTAWIIFGRHIPAQAPKPLRSP